MRKKTESTRDLFLKEIEGFLARTGMPAARLGRLAVNDTKFVFHLKDGADVRTGTMDRVRNFMANFEGTNSGKNEFARMAG